jgi:hypothetical protein
VVVVARALTENATPEVRRGPEPEPEACMWWGYRRIGIVALLF